ncbi:Transposase IS200-like protein [mine drainage metagenome]|uniref:Transposase IS200-like protein n=1 Tax=mine drainage metagenome TaxID=410659 RepID=T1DCJ9_9ZZZZ
MYNYHMSTDQFRTGRHVVYKLHAHIVLVPKYRRKVITKRVTDCLRESFDEVCSRYETTLDAFETDRDHAHLLISYPPKVSLSKLIMSLKTISSMRVREEAVARDHPFVVGSAFLVTVILCHIGWRSSA